MPSVPAARAVATDGALSLIVLVLGAAEAWASLTAGYANGITPWIVVVGTAASVFLVRIAGWASLVVLWAVFLVQFATGSDLQLVEFAVVVTAFGLARWGSTPVIWASGLSIPAATVFGLAYIDHLADGYWSTRVARNVLVPLIDAGLSWQVVLLPLIAALLAVPWLAGLVARYWGAARASQRSQSQAEAAADVARRDRAQMEEIAALRETQATLARDVHDVVGHSLTVILAQAESAQFLEETDTAALRRTMETIATSARSSLREVRAVLSASDEAVERRSDLDSLIDSSRASGVEIEVTDVGRPRPLPPEIATVAFRVLQEMLTNAIKHGARGSSVAVTRIWGDPVHITTSNLIGDASQGDRPGNGIVGMRRRLESVGGSLTGAGRSADGRTFELTAVVPVRAEAFRG